MQLPFDRRYGYVGFADMSGGVSDAAVLGIAHAEPGRRGQLIVLDRLLVEPAPHEPYEVTKRFAAELQGFQVRRVTGDRYSAEWVANAFKHYGITYEPSTLDKSAIYCEVAPLFAERRVELLDAKRLITEFRLLERRPRSAGRSDAIDHPPRAHDDCANSAAGALWLASSKQARPAGNRIRPEYSLT